MKTLYILRHAKSDRSDKFVDDFDRWLSKRWKATLEGFPELVTVKMDWVDHIIASPAKRTKETAQRWAKALWYEKNAIEYNQELYFATQEGITATLWTVDNAHDSLLYVWHNNWITRFINRCGYNLKKLPTNGIVCFSFSGNRWEDLDPWLLDFQWFEFPKKYQ